MNHGLATVKALVGTDFRNQTDLASALNVSPQAVNEVFRKGKRVPAEWCVRLERATEGKVKRHDLRPDLYPIGET